MNLIVMIGISSSGKSTTIKELYPDYIVHSSDAIREELYGDAHIQRDHHRVFEILHKRVLNDLIDGHDVVYDATNLNAKRRRAFNTQVSQIQAKHGLNVQRIAQVILAMPETCIERDKERSRSVGKDVIMRQLKQFQPPYWNEQWNDIRVTLNEPRKKVKEKLDDIFTSLKTIKHDNPYHIGTIGEHMTKVGYSLPSWWGICGHLHDIGKYYTKTLDDSYIAHYYGHEYVSSYLALLYCKAYNIVIGDLRDIAYIISLHMRHYSMPEERYQQFLSELPQHIREGLVTLNKVDRENP